MDSSKLIIYMIVACVIFIALVLLVKPLKFLLRFFVRGLFGILGFIICNFMFATFNLYVGINFLTVFLVGLLGIPGFISLYIISMIIK